MISFFEHLNGEYEKEEEPLESGSQEWLSGRRSVLLRPFWLIERVVAAKSTTSDSLFLSMLIIAISCPTVKGCFCKNSILFFFCKLEYCCAADAYTVLLPRAEP